MLKIHINNNIAILFLILFFRCHVVCTQVVFYQDIVQGGITGAGFTTCLGSGSGEIEIYIESGSTVKKAFLFCQRFGYPNQTDIAFNNEILNFNYSNQVSDIFWLPSTGASGVHAIDVTDFVNSSQNIYTVEIPPPNFSENCLANCTYGALYLCVIYENNLLSEQAITIILNNQDMINNEFYEAFDLSPIDNNYPVGFALHTDRLASTSLNDGSFVYFNNNLLGLIGGPDASNIDWGCGTKGHFYHQNNELFGLDDDIPNNIMSESDAIADVAGYVSNMDTEVNFSFEWQTPNTFYNIYIAFHLTYTTPCDIFQTDLAVEDTTICPGEPLQLGASGGINYEWLPQTGLSCYDCPNPIFTGDSSMVYTVRIWSTDSCSKVLPVKVKVLPQPEFTSINLTPSVCGEENGTIVATASNGTTPYQYQLDGGVNVANGQFNDLGSANYLLTVTDNKGCSADSTVFIDEEILVNASFTVEPPTGSAPLWVQSNNTSTNANNYSWTWADENSTDTHSGFYLDTSGNYTVTLIAYNNFPECADTFSVQVLVYDSLQISIPNVFTPNNDGNNDFFGITTNVPTIGTVIIFNRWGNLIVEKDFTTQPHVFAAFWDGREVTEGVYFYTIKLQVDDEEVEYSGFVTLVR